MRAEDVPIYFGRETINLAITTWLIGAGDVFADAEGGDVLGQLFAIFMGRKVESMLSREKIDTTAQLTAFVASAENAVAASTLARFATLEPDVIDMWYGHILDLAAKSDVDLGELSRALDSIVAVTGFFAEFRRTHGSS